MRYENIQTDETVERLLPRQYEDVLSAHSISILEMEALPQTHFPQKLSITRSQSWISPNAIPRQTP